MRENSLQYYLGWKLFPESNEQEKTKKYVDTCMQQIKEELKDDNDFYGKYLIYLSYICNGFKVNLQVSNVKNSLGLHDDIVNSETLQIKLKEYCLERIAEDLKKYEKNKSRELLKAFVKLFDVDFFRNIEGCDNFKGIKKDIIRCKILEVLHQNPHRIGTEFNESELATYRNKLLENMENEGSSYYKLLNAGIGKKDSNSGTWKEVTEAKQRVIQQAIISITNFIFDDNEKLNEFMTDFYREQLQKKLREAKAYGNELIRSAFSEFIDGLGKEIKNLSLYHKTKKKDFQIYVAMLQSQLPASLESKTPSQEYLNNYTQINRLFGFRASSLIAYQSDPSSDNNVEINKIDYLQNFKNTLKMSSNSYENLEVVFSQYSSSTYKINAMPFFEAAIAHYKTLKKDSDDERVLINVIFSMIKIYDDHGRAYARVKSSVGDPYENPVKAEIFKEIKYKIIDCILTRCDKLKIDVEKIEFLENMQEEGMLSRQILELPMGLFGKAPSKDKGEWKKITDKHAEIENNIKSKVAPFVNLLKASDYVAARKMFIEYVGNSMEVDVNPYFQAAIKFYKDIKMISFVNFIWVLIRDYDNLMDMSEDNETAAFIKNNNILIQRSSIPKYVSVSANLFADIKTEIIEGILKRCDYLDDDNKKQRFMFLVQRPKSLSFRIIYLATGVNITNPYLGRWGKITKKHAEVCYNAIVKQIAGENFYNYIKELALIYNEEVIINGEENILRYVLSDNSIFKTDLKGYINKRLMEDLADYRKNNSRKIFKNIIKLFDTNFFSNRDDCKKYKNIKAEIFNYKIYEIFNSNISPFERIKALIKLESGSYGILLRERRNGPDQTQGTWEELSYAQLSAIQQSVLAINPSYQNIPNIEPSVIKPYIDFFITLHDQYYSNNNLFSNYINKVIERIKKGEYSLKAQQIELTKYLAELEKKQILSSGSVVKETDTNIVAENRSLIFDDEVKVKRMDEEGEKSEIVEDYYVNENKSGEEFKILILKTTVSKGLNEIDHLMPVSMSFEDPFAKLEQYKTDHSNVISFHNNYNCKIATEILKQKDEITENVELIDKIVKDNAKGELDPELLGIIAGIKAKCAVVLNDTFNYEL